MERKLANALRFLALDMVERAKCGHPGMPLGMADVALTLFSKHLRFNPHNPTWFNRDRLVLSAGHGCALMYGALYLSGYENMTLDELKRFRQFGSRTPGHTEYDPSIGIDASTGPLGQGIASAVGMALAERMLNARFGNDLVEHKTYVICGDGCLAEGIGQEAISIAGHYALHNLIVLFDDNGITIDGPTSLSTSEDHLMRARAAGWHAIGIDGHDPESIDRAIAEAKASNKPTLIACKTRIGYGIPEFEGSSKVHGAAMGATVVAATRKNLDWPYDEFVVPEDIMAQWRGFWLRNKNDYDAWQASYSADGAKLAGYIENTALKSVGDVLAALKQQLYLSSNDEATRVSSGKVLEALYEHIPNLIGGSADLTPSNNTKTSKHKNISPGVYNASYVSYGEREHVMAAMMNGILLHGGLLPYSGTFLCFSDYARPAMRLSALMKLGVIYVMTHDSIGLGEDGPTHQPVEHIASFRAMPNMRVFRPCDAVETLEAWEMALQSRSTPSILALTRQAVPQTRREAEEGNLVAYGAYIIREFGDKLDLKITIFATGSEVAIAVDVAKQLEEKGMGVRVVSVPCMDLLWEQEVEYQMMLTCNSSVKVAIEAGCAFGWERLIGAHGMFFGVDSFGHSAPGNVLYEHFGLTAEHIVGKILSMYGNL